jgi:hypothetical protein
MNRMEPRAEAQHAASWWTSRLGRASHDIGQRDDDEREKSALAEMAARLIGDRFTDQQRQDFRAALADRIEEHLQKLSTGIWKGGWDPAEPQRGSANRAIGCDYGPDQVLNDAAMRAGLSIQMLDLPMKTVMWINPGVVKVAEGYNADPVVVWRKP